MNEYTQMKYVVATKRKGRVFELYFATDDRREAVKEFEKEFSEDVEAVRMYTRSQWNGARSNCRLHRQLQLNDSPIPEWGRWLINQVPSDWL